MASVTVTVADLASRFEGDLSQFTQQYLESKIGAAVRRADSRWRARIDARLASGDLDPEAYRDVICDAVARIIRNPEGFQTEADGGYSYGRRPTVASGDLWFTQDDVATLTGGEGRSMPGSFPLGLA